MPWAYPAHALRDHPDGTGQSRRSFVQLIGKIEFEPERWTAHNEAMLRSAFRHVISQQRGRLDQLEAALLAEGPLLRPEEVRK